VTITIPLTPEAEASLRARASEHGVSLTDYVRLILHQHATVEHGRRVSLEELDATLDEMAEDSAAIPVLPERAYTRESIYGEG